MKEGRTRTPITRLSCIYCCTFSSSSKSGMGDILCILLEGGGIEREKKNIESKLSPPTYNLCGRGLVLTVRLDRNKNQASCDLHPLSEIDSVGRVSD